MNITREDSSMVCTVLEKSVVWCVQYEGRQQYGVYITREDSSMVCTVLGKIVVWYVQY